MRFLQRRWLFAENAAIIAPFSRMQPDLQLPEKFPEKSAPGSSFAEAFTLSTVLSNKYNAVGAGVAEDFPAVRQIDHQDTLIPD
jgi:hypothetical protein